MSLTLTSCQNSQHSSDKLKREVSSEKIDEKHFNIEFKLLFNQYVSLYKKSPGELDELLDKEIFFGPILKASKKAYYYLFEFDRQLDEMYEACQADESKCGNSMDMESYKKLVAYRYVNKNNKESLSYFYLRLVDLANYNLQEPNPLYLETKKYIERFKKNEYKVTKIDEARKVLEQIHKRANYYITTDFLKAKNGVTFYENALDIKLSMQQLDYYWVQSQKGQPLGRMNFHNISINIQDEIRSNYKKNKNLFKEDVASMSAVADDKIVSDFLKTNESKRKPQSEFLNISGRKFKTGDWALTYDDGPKASITNQVLDTLSANNIKATFFNLAEQAERASNKDVLLKAQRLGMGLANHSYNHDDLNKKGSDLDKQIGAANTKLEQVYADNVNYFRLPYGSGTRNSRIQDYISGLGMYHFFWTVDSLDWKDPDPQSILERIIKQMQTQKRGIILLHDIKQRTADLTKLFVKYVKENNINIRSLSDILEEKGLKRVNSGPEYVAPQIKYPHLRKINVLALNARSTKDTSSGKKNVCGTFGDRSVIKVLSKSEGWYKVELEPNIINNFKENCRTLSHVYISARAKYSITFN